ncbi:MAG: hypothetical protein K2Q07_09155 [Burkholderiaceae bacterium]|nr:hypothetical protein [Burkholderiaceae bacterium]
MLKRVLGIVHRQRWADLDPPFEKTIYLSQGASLWLILSRRGNPETFVKFSRLVSLEVEAERCGLASQSFPDHAPQFIGHHQDDELHVLASRAEQFRTVTATMTESANDAQAVRRGLVGYFKQQSLQIQAAHAPAATEWLQRLEAYYADHDLARIARQSLGEVRAQLSNLPVARQHGDLVMNNLGLRPSGGLIVFDWEDFGEIGLPGLDLFTLEFSFEHESSRARAQGQRSHPDKYLDLAACCEAQRLSVAGYHALRVAHALAFLYLKRNYGPEIQGRLREHILSLAG